MLQVNNFSDLEQYIEAVEAAMPLDAMILAFKHDDSTGSKDYWDRRKTRQFINLNWWLALGGFLPTKLRQQLEAGRVVRCGDVPAWCEEDGLNLPDIEDVIESGESTLMGLHVVGSLAKSSIFPDYQAVANFKSRYKITEWNTTTMFSASLRRAEVTQEVLNNFLTNIGAKRLEDGRWSFLFKTYNELTLEWDEEHNTYIVGVDDDEKELKRFFYLNNVAIADEPHKMALLVVGYLLASFKSTELTGRFAFLSSAFVDDVYVGFTHDILEQFRRNKCGVLQMFINDKTHLPTMQDGGDIVVAASAFESRGHAVFMHKGAKYIVIDAECAGFSRNNGNTYVAWYADKEAKLTGRNLFSVATALEWVD